MREIKFRYYDDVEKEMISWESVSDDFSIFALNPPNKNKNPDDYLKWMQYTGRKDNAGVELYEGDIVKENNELAVCVWMDEAGAFLFVPVYLHPCDLTTLTTNHGNDTFFDNDSPEIYVKIVGNIYEHPHLLEGGEPNAS